MAKIKWKRADSNENWAVYHGLVDGQLRFTIIGERFGSHVDGWGLRDFRAQKSYHDRKLLSGAKLVAQKIIDQEAAA